MVLTAQVTHVTKVLDTLCINSKLPRRINLSYKAIPLQKGKTVDCLLHKHSIGYILIELNDIGEPVNAWHDTNSVISIKSKLLPLKNFADKIKCIDPRHIYLNDAKPLEMLFLSEIKVTALLKPYTRSLLAQLKFIQDNIRYDREKEEEAESNVELRADEIEKNKILLKDITTNNEKNKSKEPTDNKFEGDKNQEQIKNRKRRRYRRKQK